MENTLINLCTSYINKIDKILDDLLYVNNFEDESIDVEKFIQGEIAIQKIYFQIFEILKLRNIEKDKYFENILNFEFFDNIVYNRIYFSNINIIRSVLNIMQLKLTITCLLKISTSLDIFEKEFVNYYRIFNYFNTLEHTYNYEDYKEEKYFSEYRKMLRNNSIYEKANDPDFIDDYDFGINSRENELLIKYREGDIYEEDLSDEDRIFLKEEFGNYF